LKKRSTKKIYFDETDVNIREYTAILIAKKLELSSKSKQIIRINHFTQVAKASKNHFKTTKIEDNNTTITTLISCLKKQNNRN
jgi:DNA repair ATPase RecN